MGETGKKISGKEIEQPIEWLKEYYPESYTSLIHSYQECILLFARKHHDYGPGNIALGTQLATEEEIKASLAGLSIRLLDKTQRLVNLLVVKKTEPENESVIDTFRDIIIYGLISEMVRLGHWGK